MEDKIIKAVAKNGTVRIIAITSTDLLNTVKKIHNLNELTMIAFGKLMLSSAMISSTNKVLNDTITIKFDGNGPLKNMTAVTRGDGTLKGYISNSDAFCESLKISDLIGSGSLVITKDLGLKNPYISKVPLYRSDVCNDLAYYYTLSEQTPTAISVDIDLEMNGRVKNSLGLMVQMLPGAEDMLADVIAYRFDDLGNALNRVQNGETIYDILNFMFDDMGLKILDEYAIDYKCDCSIDKVERALISLGKLELRNIIDEGKDESIICDYCKREYKFNKGDLENLYNKMY